MKTNKEGVTFEEWVCAAGCAKFQAGEVVPYSTQSPDFSLDTPRLRSSKPNYPSRVRRAWRAGEDPAEHRT